MPPARHGTCSLREGGRLVVGRDRRLVDLPEVRGKGARPVSGVSNGWRAEAFVKHLIESEPGDKVVLNLSNGAPADIIECVRWGAEDPTDPGSYGHLVAFHEVKSSRRKAQAIRAKLTESEEAFARGVAKGEYIVWRILTHPDGGCEVISCDPYPEKP